MSPHRPHATATIVALIGLACLAGGGCRDFDAEFEAFCARTGRCEARVDSGMAFDGGKDGGADAGSSDAGVRDGGVLALDGGSCRDRGAGCLLENDCCTFTCDAGLCDCAGAGLPCKLDADCCAMNVCVDGLCHVRSAPPCGYLKKSCSSPVCCIGDSVACDGGVCCAVPGGAGTGGGFCRDTTDCCSGTCLLNRCHD